MADENAAVNVGLVLLSATQGFTAFSIFMPKIADVRATTPEANPTIAHDVRMGELAGAAITLGIGGLISVFTKSNAPIMVAGVVTVGFVSLYEITLRNIRPIETVNSLKDTTEDVRNVHVDRNEPGDFRTQFPYGDATPTYDVDRQPRSDEGQVNIIEGR